MLVVLGSGLIAAWLSAMAVASDRDSLARGADAIQLTVEEQIRILQLAGTGASSIADQPLDALDLDTLVSRIDYSVLRALLGVVSYPIDEHGASRGQWFQLGAIVIPDVEPPEIDVSVGEIEGLLNADHVFFSAPFHSTDPDRLDYVVAMPVSDGDRMHLVGVAFRPDWIIDAAVEAAGEGQYAVEVIDVRFDDQPVLTRGEPSSPMLVRRSPDGVETALELVVRPGAEFPFTQASWIVVIVLATSIVIAALLVWMGRMAKARSESLAEQLRLAQDLNESKDRFLATVSHELRTPLTVVLGVASEIGPKWTEFDEGERQELMTMMTEQAVEAANIVEDLLVAARSDPSRLRLALEKTTLRTHLDYAIGSLPEDGRERVINRAEKVAIYADTTRLRQILRNLLENAVRYGGDHITVDSTVAGGQLSVVVADDGSSLEERDLERIFEPYEQAGAGDDETLSGVGIGLYVSRLLARLMGGELDCVRDTGWTRFRLTIPAALETDTGDDADTPVAVTVG
jgi:signal transduction histidine kinase